MVNYFGFYSSKSRGMRCKQGILRPGDEPLPEVPSDKKKYLNILASGNKNLQEILPTYLKMNRPTSSLNPFLMTGLPIKNPPFR